MRKSLEHFVRDMAFSLASPFLKKGRSSTRVDPSGIERILVIRKDRAGDAVCSLPVVAALKKYLPQVKIDVVGSPRNAEVFGGDPRINRLYVYQKWAVSDLSHVKEMRANNYNVVIDLIGDDSVTALLMSQIYSVKGIRIGVGKRRFARFYDFAFDYESEPIEHMLDLHLKALRPFGIDERACDRYVTMHSSEQDHNMARSYFGSLGTTPDALVVGYNLSVGKAERVWSFERSVELTDRIGQAVPGCRIVLFTTPADRGLAERLQQRVAASTHLIPPGLSLQQVSAFISGLDILVTPDTALVHVARSWRKPVVAMYPEWDEHRFALWKPFGQSDGIVMSHTGDHVFDITVDEMMTAFRSVVSRLTTESRCHN